MEWLLYVGALIPRHLQKRKCRSIVATFQTKRKYDGSSDDVETSTQIREKTMFHYLGNVRLQLWFFSPNICATFLMLSIMLTIGLFFYTTNKIKTENRIFSVCLLALICLQLFMIAATYSRGGYLACFIGLFLAFIISRKRWSIVFVFIFIMILLFVGDGPSRVKSIGNLEDGSIRNRFLIWKGGTGIIADHFLTGIGAPPAAGNYYTLWYQPLWLNERYNTLISDYLTIAASYGIFVLFLILALLFFLLFQSYNVWKTNHDMMLLYSMCAIVGYMVSALFSTCYRFKDLSWLLIMIILIVTVYIIHGIKKNSIKLTYYDFLYPFLLSIIICVVIVGYGKYTNMQKTYSIHQNIISIDNHDYSILELSPKSKSSKTLIFLTSDIRNEIRAFLRPAANIGYKVKAIQMDLGLIGLKKGLKLLPVVLSGESNVYLVGAGTEKAILTLALATHFSPQSLSGVIVYNIPYEWPFDELSPKSLVAQLKVPLFLRQNEKYAYDGKLLAELCKKNKQPIHFEIIP